MKLKLLNIALLGSLFFNTAASQGVPVIDASQVANQIKQWGIELEQFNNAFKVSQEQLKTQANQLASLTGVRDIQEFMNQANSIFSQVKDLDKWLDQQNDILSYGKDILSSDLKQIFDSYGLTNKCEVLTDRAKKSCEGEIIVDVIKQQNNKNNLNVLNDRLNTINSIAKRMEKAKDQKETLDLANAMNTQLALLQADKIKMDIQKSIDESQLRLIEKQEKDRIKEINNIHEIW